MQNSDSQPAAAAEIDLLRQRNMLLEEELRVTREQRDKALSDVALLTATVRVAQKGIQQLRAAAENDQNNQK